MVLGNEYVDYGDGWRYVDADGLLLAIDARTAELLDAAWEKRAAMRPGAPDERGAR